MLRAKADKIVDIVGAQPRFIKVAPVLRAIQSHNETHPENLIQEVLVPTEQHYNYEISGFLTA